MAVDVAAPCGVVTADGLTLAGRLWTAPGAPRAGVVLAHGFGGSVDDAGLCALAGRLQRRGLDVLAVHSRGHHGSEGLCTLGDRERLDVAAAAALCGQRADRVVLVGASMGAIAVLRHAASAERDPAIVGAVTVSCPAAWRLPRTPRALAVTALTRTRWGRAFAARRSGVRVAPGWHGPEPPEALAARLELPLAVIHGARDRLVLPSAAHRLHSLGEGPRALWVLPAMRHAFDGVAVLTVHAGVEWVLARG